MFRNYGDWSGANKLFEAFLQKQAVEGIDDGEELTESGSTSDFANYLADKASKRLMWGYKRLLGVRALSDSCQLAAKQHVRIHAPTRQRASL
jgi:hypothetical protein